MITRLVWAVRRELWESRWLCLAPMIMGVVLAVGYGAYAVGHSVPVVATLDGTSPRRELIAPYEMAANLMMIVGLLLAVIYSVEALYGERRDRSVYLWRSLPVSDRLTVLAKLLIPTVMLPLIVWASTVGAHIIMAITSSAISAASGHSVNGAWSALRVVTDSGALLYHLLAVHGLFTAPIYAWCLVVSAWAPRAPLAWALLPPVALGFAERLATGRMRFAELVLSRVGGSGLLSTSESVNDARMDGMTALPISQFLAAPGLWVGFVVTALLFALTVQLRRRAHVR